MIKNLYRLGKALQTKDKYNEYFFPWQNPFPNTDPDKAKVICFNIREGKISGEYELEPFKRALLKEYLYRKLAGANAAPLVPTDFFYPKKKESEHQDSVRKLVGRLQRAFPVGKSLFFPTDEYKEAALAEVENALIAFTGDLDNRYLITFKVDGKWLGDFDNHITLFEEEAYSKYYEKSSGTDKLCSVSYQSAPEVWGRIDTLGFTVNDGTFSRSGFDGKESYKMFPVSPDAVKLLEGARRFALEQLTRNFYTLRYFIVPHFIEGKDELMLEAVRGIAQADTKNTVEDLSKSIFNNEKVIAVLAEDEEISKAGVFYDIFFFEENQAQFSIKLHLTDIMPSRFRRIFGAKQLVEARFRQINRIPTKDGAVEFFVTFKIIQRYFSTVIKKETVFHPFFFTVLEAVFYGRKLDELSVIDSFMAQIRDDFKQRNESANRFITRTKEAFALWHFFYELELFDHKNKYPMEKQPVARTLDEFIEQHPAFFSTPYKKAAFLMGCLVELLLYAQRRKLNSEPFLEQLQGLNLDENDLQKLFPRLMEKTSQYHDQIEKFQRDYVQQLRSEIVPILMEPAKANRAEISFAFTSGIVMQKEFTENQIAMNKAKKQTEQAESAA